MKHKILITLFMAAALITQSQKIYAQTAATGTRTDGWNLLGSRTVDYLIDRDEIDVPSGMFIEIKLHVKNGTLSMYKCTMLFSDGSTQDIEFPDNVKASTERTIDLKGSNLKLSKVIFWYDTNIKSGAKAIVELWGKK